ncbi:hypothetical protein EYF80_061512 [Liparis tanakae]|uniref:Uncharacterized protein n=1 Tax=Liparis tanakae TaxID=230148 RepID=A0A4Z2EHX2_9TELE|nr:hypothetical protein EYF80_061512 [Liparis tanakae]
MRLQGREAVSMEEMFLELRTLGHVPQVPVHRGAAGHAHFLWACQLSPRLTCCVWEHVEMRPLVNSGRPGLRSGSSPTLRRCRCCGRRGSAPRDQGHGQRSQVTGHSPHPAAAGCEGSIQSHFYGSLLRVTSQGSLLLTSCSSLPGGGAGQEEQDWRSRAGGAGLEEQDWRSRTGGAGQEEQDWRSRAGGAGQEEQDWRSRTGGGPHGGGGLKEQDWRRKTGGAGLEEQDWRSRAGGAGQEEQGRRSRTGGAGQEEQDWRSRTGGAGLEEDHMEEEDWRSRTGGAGLEEDHMEEEDWRSRTGGAGLEEQDWRSRPSCGSSGAPERRCHLLLLLICSAVSSNVGVSIL